MTRDQMSLQRFGNADVYLVKWTMDGTNVWTVVTGRPTVSRMLAEVISHVGEITWYYGDPTLEQAYTSFAQQIAVPYGSLPEPEVTVANGDSTVVGEATASYALEAECPACGLPAEVPGEGRYCGACEDFEGHCRNDHCMTCGKPT